MDSMIPKI